jgi:hypothetical protein
MIGALPRLFRRSVAVSKMLSVDEFYTAYLNLCKRTNDRIFKLERIQSYQEPDNASYIEFSLGNIEHAVKLLPDVRAIQAEHYTDLFRRGLQFIRVRAVEFPLSKYLEWEFKGYPINAKYGETILIADITSEPISSALRESSDFMLFDSFAILIHDYNAEGILSGGWLCEDKNLIMDYQELADIFISKSVPLAVFERQHGLD